MIYTRLFFEWDPKKARINYAKHGVSFVQASAVFDDPRALYRQDAVHSKVEPRLHIMGHAGGKLLAVCYTLRGLRVRLISARRASRQERRTYAEAQN